MRLKLDENLGERGRLALSAAGHDVCTVGMQRLESVSDRELLARCVAENRGLVTLDLDFANPIVFPPSQHAGMAVIRLPRKPTCADLDRAIATLVKALVEQPLDRQLWIEEIERVRVYTPAS